MEFGPRDWDLRGDGEGEEEEEGEGRGENPHIQWNPAITDLKGLTVFFRLCRIPVLPI